MWSTASTAARVARNNHVCLHRVGKLLPVIIYRSFFPNLSGVMSQGNRRSHRERRVVPYSPEQFFDVVADVDNYKKFVPFCVDSRVVKVINDDTMEAEMSVGFKLFTEKYTSRVATRRPNEVAVKAVHSRLFSSLDSTWRFRPTGNPNTTLIDFSVEFEVKNLLAAQAMDVFFEEVALQQVKAFERRCRHLYGTSPTATRKRAVEEAAAQAAGVSGPCGGFLFPVKDALAVETHVNVVRDACLRHATPSSSSSGGGSGDGVRSGQEQEQETKEQRGAAEEGRVLTVAQFQAACADLAGDEEFGEFKKLAENDGLSSAVFSSLQYLMRRRLSRGLTSLGGTAGDEAKACLAVETKGVPEGAMLEFAISVYMMVQASAEDRALYIFSILDTNGNKQLDRQELQAALLLYMKSLARIIPTVVAHELKDMGKLVDKDIDINSDQVKEEIVSVVDELMHEVTADIPRAVDQIFEELGILDAGCISEDEWEGAWQNFPELLDMMSLRGLGKTAHWAVIVLDHVVANNHNRPHQREREPRD
ncbi:unnamed protein product [Pylaiella littoralis]